MSPSTLSRVWQEFFQDVKLPKKHRFSKCETCSRLRRMIDSDGVEDGHTLNAGEAARLKAQKVISCVTSLLVLIF